MPLQKISYGNLLFSLDGRIPISTLWLKYYIPYIVVFLICVIVDVRLGTFYEKERIGLISGLANLLLLYPSIAVMVKRIHDHGLTGWLVLLLLVPAINVLFWIFLSFMTGTEGPNKYGPDPLAERTEDTVIARDVNA
jgi:uncharacterized membrane protein YhaH (DUF805 family)